MGWISRRIDTVRDGYAAAVARLARVAVLSLAVLAAAGIGIVAVGARTPSGFLPQEDQGAFFIETKLPDGASLNRTREVVGQIETVVAGLPGIRDVSVIAGYSC